jgi:hypothetical protein
MGTVIEILLVARDKGNVLPLRRNELCLKKYECKEHMADIDSTTRLPN